MSFTINRQPATFQNSPMMSLCPGSYALLMDCAPPVITSKKADAECAGKEI